MTDVPRRLSLIGAALGLVILASTGLAQQWGAISSKPRPHMATNKPKVSVLCLTPGGTKPVPCATANVGPALAIRIDEDIPACCVLLRFRVRPVDLQGQQIDVPFRAGNLKRGQIHRIAVPRQLCAGQSSVQFELQIKTQDNNNAETAKTNDADSIGYFQMRCT